MVRQAFDKDAVTKALKCSLKEALNAQVLQEKLSHGGFPATGGFSAATTCGAQFDRISCPYKSFLRCTACDCLKKKNKTQKPHTKTNTTATKPPKLLYL